MASVLPAMKGKFGSTDYYIITMSAIDLTQKLTIPSEIEGWDDLSLEERYQREVNYRRVASQIAPYLASDPDRFFGAFIVMIYRGEVDFEPISRIYSGKVPKLYSNAAEAFGFLNFEGDEILVPLDGQHRLTALRFAITGKNERQQELKDVKPTPAIASDDCTVILVESDEQKNRKIFNKVNRYAKSTTKAENLITADDDIVAVIVRNHIVGSEGYIPGELVNASGNTLNDKAIELTTLSTLYEATRAMLEDTHGRISQSELPTSDICQVMRDEAEDFWRCITTNIAGFGDLARDFGDGRDDRIREYRRDYVLGKPVAQWALVEALVRLRTPDPETGQRLSLEDACQRANRLSWRSDDERWQHVLMSGKRVMSGKTTVKFAGEVIAYWLGAPTDDERLGEMKARHEAQGAVSELAEPMV